MEIGRRLAGWRRVKPTDIRSMGLPDNIAEALEERQRADAELENSDTIEFYVQDAPALDIFLHIRAAGLWRYAPMGGILGIDWQQTRHYPRIPADTPLETWAGVTALESGYINEINRE